MSGMPCRERTSQHALLSIMQGVPSVGGFLAGLTLGLKW